MLKILSALGFVCRSQLNESLQANDELLEDVALALLGVKTKGSKSTVKVSSAPTVKHTYNLEKPVAKSTATQMIKNLEAKLQEIPDGARGTGGIEVIVKGKKLLRIFPQKVTWSLSLKS